MDRSCVEAGSAKRVLVQPPFNRVDGRSALSKLPVLCRVWVIGAWICAAIGQTKVLTTPRAWRCVELCCVELCCAAEACESGSFEPLYSVFVFACGIVALLDMDRSRRTCASSCRLWKAATPKGRSAAEELYGVCSELLRGSLQLLALQ